MTIECLPNNETNPNLTKEVFTMLYYGTITNQVPNGEVLLEETMGVGIR